MYEHHQESIKRLIAYFKDDPSVVALVLGGSVARGEARADSDVDAEVIVTPAEYERRKAAHSLSECIYGHCAYEGGYFDIKYCTKEFLAAAARRGSEPARNAFRGARCLFARDNEIPGLVDRIPIFQKREKADKMLSFYAALRLNIGYFWDMSRHEPYLRARAAADTVLFGLRMLLQENEVLFPCHKGLMAAVEKLESKPAGIVSKACRLLRDPTDGQKDDFVKPLLRSLAYRPPEDYRVLLTRYIDDNEQWWYNDRPVIAEW